MEPTDIDADQAMGRYYAERANYCERVYHKPERQHDLRRMEADLPARFDAAFAGCWWSHVPPARLRVWLETLHSHLAPGAHVVMLDNSFVQTSNLPISRRDAEGNTYQMRTLDDGATYEVVKNFPTADEAIAALGARARDARWIAYEYDWMLAYDLA